MTDRLKELEEELRRTGRELVSANDDVPTVADGKLMQDAADAISITRELEEALQAIADGEFNCPGALIAQETLQRLDTLRES